VVDSAGAVVEVAVEDEVVEEEVVVMGEVDTVEADLVEADMVDMVEEVIRCRVSERTSTQSIGAH